MTEEMTPLDAKEFEIAALKRTIHDLVQAVRAHDFAIKNAIETGDTSADATHDTLVRLRRAAEKAAKEIA